MPTYEYVCNVCGSDLEIVQSMSEPSLTVCPNCGAEGLRKLFRGVGIHFKGSGFYRTDSKGKSKSTADSSSTSATKSESTGSDSKTAASKSESSSSSASASSGSASSSSASSGSSD